LGVAAALDVLSPELLSRV